MMPLIMTLKLLWLMPTVLAQGAPNESLEAWQHFRALAAPLPGSRTPEVEQQLRDYLMSISLEDLLTTARQGCVAGANKPKLTLDWERDAAAQSNALLCLESYFEIRFRGDSWRKDCQEIAGRLMEVAADSRELSCLRRAILARLSYSENTRFQVALVDYPAAHASEVDRFLGMIIDDHLEEADMRKEAISAMRRDIHRQLRRTYESDRSLQEAVRQARKQTNARVNAGELLRSGNATLTDDTRKALEPIVERMRRNIVSLTRILADGNAPSTLRQAAMRTLKSYRQSAITELDEQIDAVLENTRE